MCRHRWIRNGDIKICSYCGKRVQRFIRPQPNPLFLNLEAKNEETKRFLSELTRPKPKKEKYVKEGLLFFRDSNGKIVDVEPLYKYSQRLERVAERLAQELRERK